MNRSKGVWVRSDNGRIIQILGVINGMAVIDIKGSGLPATKTELVELAISDAERERLGALYSPGQSLWRVPIQHFTPWDCNWPFGPPFGTVRPNQKIMGKNKTDNPDIGCGSIIEIQNQVLGENVEIPGISFSLHYSSDRTRDI